MFSSELQGVVVVVVVFQRNQSSKVEVLGLLVVIIVYYANNQINQSCVCVCLWSYCKFYNVLLLSQFVMNLSHPLPKQYNNDK